MRNKLYVVGIGPGEENQLTLYARSVIDGAGLVVAAKRHMGLAKGNHVIPLGKFSEAFQTIDKALNDVSVAVLVSGDTGVYSLMPLVKKRFPDDDVHVVPGISSLQTLCAAIGETWIDAKIISGHGRDISEASVLDTVDQNAKTIFFCGPDWTPQKVCSVLSRSEMQNLTVTVGEHLSYYDERVLIDTPQKLSGIDFDDLSIMLITNPAPWEKPAVRPHDDEFIRTQVPMTREVVRGAILDALRLKRDSVVWDLGAGTGSVTVAAALVCDCGSVYAVERKDEAVQLIKSNCRKFHRHNVNILLGDNMTQFKTLPLPTHVFIGGSSGELKELLEKLPTLGSGIRVVVSSVALKTASAATEVLSSGLYSDFAVTSVAVSNSKKIGNTYIMAANNQVSIFSGVTCSAITQKEGNLK